jgi:hypothetical protein
MSDDPMADFASGFHAGYAAEEPIFRAGLEAGLRAFADYETIASATGRPLDKAAWGEKKLKALLATLDAGAPLKDD